MSGHTVGGESASPSSEGLARERTSWAAERTWFAANRTLIAWVRTSLSLISFGFTFVKFFEFLSKTLPSSSLSMRGPRVIGVALVLLGTVTQLFTAFQSLRLRKQLGRSPEGESWPGLPGTVAFAFAIALVGIAATVLLLLPTAVEI